MESTTPQNALTDDQKIDVYSTIKNLVDDFLESDLTELFDKKQVSLSKNGISIVIDTSNFKSEQ